MIDKKRLHVTLNRQKRTPPDNRADLRKGKEEMAKRTGSRYNPAARALAIVLALMMLSSIFVLVAIAIRM